MIVLLVIVLLVAGASLVLNAAYIAHELGWFPHTKDRTSPVERAFPFASRYEVDVLPTHDFQVMDPNTQILRRHGHADVYGVSDPHEALRNVIRRYQAEPTRSRYDDLVHVSNHVCNQVRCDEQVNQLIGEIVELMHTLPVRGA